MNELIKWLSSGSVSASIMLILVSFILAVLSSIYLIAFLQGREISFWPPKIGERKKDDNDKSDKANIDNEKLDEILKSIKWTTSIAENILQFQIIDKIHKEFGVKFNLVAWGDIEPEEGRPEDKDTPFILFFSTDTKSVNPGGQVNVLFRVADQGQNFVSTDPNAIEIVDISNMIMFPSRYVGRGYHFTQIHFPENATLGYHKISFNLKDLKKNTFTQSFKVLVEKTN